MLNIQIDEVEKLIREAMDKFHAGDIDEPAQFVGDALRAKYQKKGTKFFSVFEDETIQEALRAHSTGFDSIQAAVDDAKANSQDTGIKFTIINEFHDIVHEDKV
jgi:hypothetical protein